MDTTNLASIFIIIAPGVLVALVVATDIPPRRRYYLLGALALGTLILALWGFGAFAQSADIDSALLYLIGEPMLALTLTLCAVGVAAKARDWWWLGIILIVSVVPGALIFTAPATILPNLLDTLGLTRYASLLVFALLSLPPTLVTCAYAITQSVRWPFARSRAHGVSAGGDK